MAQRVKDLLPFYDVLSVIIKADIPWSFLLLLIARFPKKSLDSISRAIKICMGFLVQDYHMNHNFHWSLSSSITSDFFSVYIYSRFNLSVRLSKFKGI